MLLLALLTLWCPPSDSLLISDHPAMGGLLRTETADPEESDFEEETAWKKDHPLDLNKVSAEELEELPFVTPREARAVVEFRERITRYSSVEQIAVIEDVGEQVYEKISSFVYVKKGKVSGSHTSRPFFQSRSRMTRTSTPLTNGASDVPLAVWKLSEQIRIEPANYLSADLSLRRNPGERFDMTFASGNLMLDGLPLAGRILAGDFAVDAGQGFVASSSTRRNDGRMGNGSRTAVRPYHGTSELSFFRGMAAQATIPLGSYETSFLGYASRRVLPGTLNDDESLRAFYPDGTYRTENEIRKRGVVDERSNGGRIEFRKNDDWKVGATIVTSFANRTVSGWDTLQRRNQRTTVAGIDAEWRFDRLVAHGEYAVTAGGGRAVELGLTVETLGRLIVATSVRTIDPDYLSVRGAYSTSNETGWRLSAVLPVGKTANLRMATEEVRHRWRTYTIPVPSRSRRSEFEFDDSFADAMTLHARWVHRSWEEAVSLNLDGITDRRMVDRVQDRISSIAIYGLPVDSQIKVRADWTRVRKGTGGGVEQGASCEVSLQSQLWRQFTLDIATGWFQTDSFDAGLYLFERDLPGMFTSRSVSGAGLRAWVRCIWTPSNVWTFSAKFSHSMKEGGVDSTHLREFAADEVWYVGFQIDTRLFD